MNLVRSMEDADEAIVVEGLGKRYSIGRHRNSQDGIRHAVEEALRSPIAWMKRRREEKRQQTDFWALRDASLTIKRGEVLGIVGRNGAGKSTLLKLLSRITEPSEGRIRINGRIGSLLEVGTGFHMELTGRENIFMNGAILGMSRAEIIRKFDEIVAFSEVEDFLDTPVKRYSSGMYVRLAFAVAAHLDPEILIVDEVLAVGDTAFQNKCLGKIGSIAQGGRTVLFVSHSLDSVRGLCQTGLWLRAGRVQMKGNAGEVIDAYLNNISQENPVSCTNADFGFSIERLALKNGSGKECTVFAPGEDLTVEICYLAQKRMENPYFTIGVLGANGSCFTSNMLMDGYQPAYIEGEGTIRCTFRAIPLLPQNFSVKLRVEGGGGRELIIPYQDVASFSVAGDLADYGYQGEYAKWARYSTPVVVPYEWTLPDGTTASVSLARSPELAGSSFFQGHVRE